VETFFQSPVTLAKSAFYNVSDFVFFTIVRPEKKLVIQTFPAVRVIVVTRGEEEGHVPPNL